MLQKKRLLCMKGLSKAGCSEEAGLRPKLEMQVDGTTWACAHLALGPLRGWLPSSALRVPHSECNRLPELLHPSSERRENRC